MISLSNAEDKELILFYKMSKQNHIGSALNEKSLKQFQNEFHDENLVYMSIYKDGILAGTCFYHSKKKKNYILSV